ncbi:MAG TPA: family 1 glycosylhydrolase [Acidimicrobiales bacterium]|nr:family 1 glycosylhydrolase [Acidimicrobiales bacterium]
MTTFPDPFWWGTGASSTQCEGAAPASNWARWEQLGRAPESAEGNGFGHRHAEDFALLAEHGLTHHRLSIEWARIEPRQGQRDNDAVEHYRRVLEAARDAGMNPWVCLHHFTLPGWFADDLGGFLDEKAARYWWPRHVDFVAETFGDLVFGWKPVNEPVAYALTGFLMGVFPPGRQDIDDFRSVVRNIHRANADAANLLRGTDAPVATIHNLSPIYTADATPEAAARAARVDEMIWRSWAEPELLDPFDLLGFSYYAATAVHGDGTQGAYPADATTGPMGYAPWSPGLGEVLHRLAEEHPDKPILIDECGIGTHDDEWRATYLRECVDETERALADGIDVRGFFHWTAVDNYEWLHGYTVPFGLFDRDRNPRSSIEVLSRGTGT